MGETADIMTRKDALKIRSFLAWLLEKDENQYHYVAIAKTHKWVDDDDWSVFIYGNHEETSFTVDGALLFKALENIVISFSSKIGHYDAGTTKPDIRCAAILR